MSDTDHRALAKLLVESHRDRARHHVFVCGMPRSGTSALRTALERQPAFGSRGGALSPETELFLSPDILFRPESRKGTKAYRFLRDEDAANRIAQTLAPLERLYSPLNQAARRAIPGKPEPIGYAPLLRAFFHAAAAEIGTTDLVEKTPAHINRVERIIRTFPQARVIVCVRNPLDRYASFRKRAAREDAEDNPNRVAHNNWLRATPDDFISAYVTLTGQAIGAASRWPRLVRILRYEDLTAAPEATMRSLLSWTGHDFDVDVFHDADPEARNATARPIEATESRWAEWIEADEARHIVRQLSVPMSLFGYESPV